MGVEVAVKAVVEVAEEHHYQDPEERDMERLSPTRGQQTVWPES